MYPFHSGPFMCITGDHGRALRWAYASGGQNCHQKHSHALNTYNTSAAGGAQGDVLVGPSSSLSPQSQPSNREEAPITRCQYPRFHSKPGWFRSQAMGQSGRSTGEPSSQALPLTVKQLQTRSCGKESRERPRPFPALYSPYAIFGEGSGL